MYYADMAVHGKDRHLQLLVEVKSKRGASKIWATKMRRNMYAHGLLPEAPFFLLALPDKFYLWKNIGLSTDLIEPDDVVLLIETLKTSIIQIFKKL